MENNGKTLRSFLCLVSALLHCPVKAESTNGTFEDLVGGSGGSINATRDVAIMMRSNGGLHSNGQSVMEKIFA